MSAAGEDIRTCAAPKSAPHARRRSSSRSTPAQRSSSRRATRPTCGCRSPWALRSRSRRCVGCCCRCARPGPCCGAACAPSPLRSILCSSGDSRSARPPSSSSAYTSPRAPTRCEKRRPAAPRTLTPTLHAHTRRARAGRSDAGTERADRAAPTTPPSCGPSNTSLLWPRQHLPPAAPTTPPSCGRPAGALLFRQCVLTWSIFVAIWSLDVVGRKLLRLADGA
eukprot:3733408-Prymnesium_polylepis.1